MDVDSNNSVFQLWRQDNHPIELSTAKMLQQRLDYIHHNPVEAGFVLSPEDYVYSSAKDYYGIPSELLSIKLVDQIVF
jgi:putative transposase